MDARDLADADSRWISLGDSSYHYKVYRADARDAPAIVLLHGFGASLYSWREVAEPLSSLSTVIAYDRLAFGLSDRPVRWKGPSPYSTATQVEALFGLLDALGEYKAVLVGNSAGGAIALEAALKRPERVVGLVLVSPAVDGGVPGWIKPIMYLPGVDHIGPLLARRLQSSGDGFLRSAWHDQSKLTPEVAAAYRAPLSIAGWERGLWNFSKSAGSNRLARSLGEVAAPVLVISGDDDRIVPIKDSERVARAIPGAVLEIVPDSGHVVHEEDPAAFIDAFERFWRRLGQGGG